MLAEEGFQAWSGQHFLLLFLTASGAAVAVWWAAATAGLPESSRRVAALPQ